MAPSTLVRLAPLQLGELPNHPLIQKSDDAGTNRPDLVKFLRTFLDDGNAFINDSGFNVAFKSNSFRPAPPANLNVEVLTHDVTAEQLAKLDWSATNVDGFQRTRPRSLSTEHWFARRSQHPNKSVKTNPSTANWDEFVFGLRDEHSKHEQDFTPTIYDARCIVDWSEQISAHLQSSGGKLDTAHTDQVGTVSYTNITLAVYEMCHALPWPLAPRCFPVLVATASTCPTRFIAVTVPVNLSSFSEAFYSTGRNKTEGTSSQHRKEVTLAQYAAVESVSLYTQERNKKPGEKEEFIQWVMATASDAKGNLPMSVQKSSMPSQLPKDVSYFLKWIHTVDDNEVQKNKAKQSTAA